MAKSGFWYGSLLGRWMQGALLLFVVPSTTYADSRATIYDYYPDGFSYSGKLKSIDGPRTDVNDTTSFKYDAAGNLETVTNALGHVYRYSNYFSSGNPGRIEDPNGVITEFDYDLQGRILSHTLIDPNDPSRTEQTSYLYDGFGNISSVTGPNGAVYRFQYDSANRLKTQVNPFGEKTEYEYDRSSNVTAVHLLDSGESVFRSVRRIYDYHSRLIAATHRNDVTLHQQIEYDDSGKPLSVIDLLGNKHSYHYDHRSFLSSKTFPDASQATFGHDSLGRLLSVTDQRGLTTAYEYDGYDQVIKIISPDNGETRYFYDEAGNLTKQIDARGVESNYTYDPLNRLISINYPTSSDENVSFEYDDTTDGNSGVGRLTSLSYQSGSTRYIYDHGGRLLSRIYTIEGKRYEIIYAYDSHGDLLSVTYPSGKTLGQL